MKWAEFAASLGVFLLSHAMPVRPPVKTWLIGLIGQRGLRSRLGEDWVSGLGE